MNNRDMIEIIILILFMFIICVVIVLVFFNNPAPCSAYKDEMMRHVPIRCFKELTQ